MLEFLKIKNLALLDSVELDFARGFTAVTGETGAGKSVLLGALSLLSGSRADKSIIKQDTPACEITASLNFPNPARINALLDSLDLPLCQDGSLLLKRTIPREKSQKIQINGELATLTALQQLGEHWIDFHGPGEPQKLFAERYQLQMLDLYIGIHPLLAEYKDLFSAWKATLKKSKDLASAEQLSEDEIDFLQSQINNIQAVNPTPDSIEQLEQNFTRISRSNDIAHATSDIYSLLHSPSGALSQLQKASRSSASLSTIDPSTEELHKRILSLVIETEDLAQEFKSIAQDIDTDPQAIESIQHRMNLWLQIQRKYGSSPDAVLKKLNTLKEKISSQSNIEVSLHKLEQEARIQEIELKKVATKLDAARSKGAQDFINQVHPLLKSLGFKNAQINIALIPEPHFKDFGQSHAQFQFSPNPGQDLMPLNKIASSGETARLMLALKAILAQADKTPLLVFDEVDANVGGEIASQVAQQLKKLSAGHQVFCITHLPQVASQANNHLLVNKIQKEVSTEVEIYPIETPEARIQEIARMLGDRNSRAAISHAEELLGMATAS